MLRCHCEILKPFTLVTNKKTNLIIRYYSVARTLRVFECSCYDKGIFLHFEHYKRFVSRHWEFQKFFKKEQKNLIYTSVILLKNNNDNKISSIFTEKKDENSEKTESSNNVHLKKKIVELDKNNGLKTTHLTEKQDNNFNIGVSTDKNQVTTLKENQILYTDGRTKNVSFSTLKTNSEKIDELDEKYGKTYKENSNSSKTSSEKIDSSVLESIILSKSSSNEKSILRSQVTERVSEIEPKLLVNPVLKHCDSQTTEEQLEIQKKSSEKVKNTNDFEEKKDGEIKRQVQKIDLGNFNKEMKLKELPEILDYETVRFASEIKPQKETPQKLLLEKAKSILKKTASTLKTEDDSRNTKLVSLGTPKGDVNLNTNRRRQTVDLNKCSTERNFITPVRAMTDFLLKPSDLEGLRKTKRRSPYENDPPITVYWRKDVEAKALDVWGSKENLLKEILKRDIERRRYQQNIFTVKRRLRDYRREQGRETEIKLEQNGLFGPSGRVVLTAIAINGTNFLFKLLAWLYTGSHSMFSETIHSLADTINQLILAYGIHKSVQRADSDHPYGYTNMRYVASLISGVGIFCVGSGLSCYHGYVGLTDPSDLPSFYWAYFILAGSLASEGATLLVAFNSIRLGARKSEMSLSEYVLRGQDPSVNVVFLEDLAAVIGVGFAGCCMGLSSFYNSHIPDAIGSFLVGGLLAGVASFIIYTNVAALVGRSIPQERLDKINAELESDVMIRAIHDVKGIDIGNSLVRYKAEMDFDGGELTRSYLDKQDLNQMLEEVKKMKTIDELEEFMLKHGENIVDMMGGEIDRIELKLRKKHPEIRHCDLEIL